MNDLILSNQKPIPKTEDEETCPDAPCSRYRHKSGVITYEEQSVCVMVCPDCGVGNEFPFNPTDVTGDHSDDSRAICYGGCGETFDLDD